MTSADEATPIRDTDLESPALERALARTWSSPRGIVGWFCTVDHKIIGRRYIVTAFVFLALGGPAAVAMRVQLAWPENRLIDPDLYNQLFTMHGTTTLWRRTAIGHGARPPGIACFLAGWGLMAVALISPLHDLSRALFSAHMIEHELVMAAAAPLLVLSRPYGVMLWALPPALRDSVGRLLRQPLPRRKKKLS
jgi:hypothetical protein